MPGRLFRCEIAGGVRVGLEFDSELELEEFLGQRGIVLVEASGAVPQTEPSAPVIDEQRARGRPSRGEEIAAAIDALDDELERCGSIKAQARAVRTYLEEHAQGDEPAPALSTIETYVSVYRKPRPSSALKIAKKFSGG